MIFRGIQIGFCWLNWMILFIIGYSRYCDTHGRLIEPPSRASAWRYGFQTLPDYNDHELYCGGFTRQWIRNGGKCGECGDAWDMPQPRPHENGGQWGQGVIVRKYMPGSDMIIRIELTASHLGYFEFRLCPEPNAKQICLDRCLLQILGGTPARLAPSDLNTRFYPRNGSRIYEIKAKLPDIKCDQCVLQWRYVAGNNWGICSDGNGAVGCGPQEEFRSCSDITLGVGAHTPLHPLRPTSRTTLRPEIYSTSTEIIQKNVLPEHENYVSALIVILILFVTLCAVGIWYFFYDNDERVKEWLEYLGRFCRRPNKRTSVTPILTKATILLVADDRSNSTKTETCILNSAPIPPKRTKRQLTIIQTYPDLHSIT